MAKLPSWTIKSLGCKPKCVNALQSRITKSRAYKPPRRNTPPYFTKSSHASQSNRRKNHQEINESGITGESQSHLWYHEAAQLTVKLRRGCACWLMHTEKQRKISKAPFCHSRPNLARLVL